MNLLNLLWIVPASAFFGAVVLIVVALAKMGTEDDVEWDDRESRVMGRTDLRR